MLDATSLWKTNFVRQEGAHVYSLSPSPFSSFSTSRSQPSVRFYKDLSTRITARLYQGFLIVVPSYQAIALLQTTDRQQRRTRLFTSYIPSLLSVMTSAEFDWKALMAGDLMNGTLESSHTSQGNYDFPHNTQHLSATSTSQANSNASSSTLPAPRLKRPASTSSYPCIASSPGPIRTHSSPPQPVRSMSKFAKNRRAEMDGKCHE